MTKADDEIQKALAEKKRFVLDAGAGSGKTYSLVQALTFLRQKDRRAQLEKNRQRIACITYTNVAKDEIVERVEHDSLIEVATIHEFLWQNIKEYQPELRRSVLRFNNELPEASRRKKDAAELAAVLDQGMKIDYSEFGSNLIEGRIFHDDLLAIAKIIFEENPLLARLTGIRYPYILVDEYQDTSPLVISILLDHVRVHAEHFVVGFFGDKKQAIYDDVVGEMSDQHKELLIEIKKEENYRCAKSVIEVLNKLRADIQQVPVGENVDGAAVYVGVSDATRTSVEQAYEAVRPQLAEPPDFRNAKVLYLTHRLIAREAGYEKLFTAYNTLGGYAKDQFQSGSEPIASYLAFQVDELGELWATGDEAAALTLLQEAGFQLKSIQDKRATKGSLDVLTRMLAEGRSVAEVIGHIEATHLLHPPDKLEEGGRLAAMPEEEVAEDDQRLYAFFKSLLAIDCREIRAYRSVLQNNMPYATKHGVKGDEFDTVIVVLDDAGARWNKYAFGKQFEGADNSADRWERTSNLLYVCCSRAKINLVVVDMGYTAQRKAGIDRIFGEAHLII